MKFKYAPLSLSQTSETHKELSELLTTLLEVNSIAILLCASKYAGKTTFLNILLHEYFQKVDDEKKEQNILRVNHWSAEQGILFYRENLKTFCQTSSCIKDKKKVIVVDDIDLLSESRQQMFRNCIDKYNQSIHFIFTCTNLSRVLSSIQSRLLILSIKPLTLPQTKSLFHRMLIQEKLGDNMDDDMIEFLTKLASGNMKRLMTYLELLKLYCFTEKEGEKWTQSFIMDLCSTIPFLHLSHFLDACIRLKNIEKGVELIKQMPFSLLDILDNLFFYVKRDSLFQNENDKSLLLLTEKEKHFVINVITKYVALLHTLHEDDELESILFTYDLTLI